MFKQILSKILLLLLLLDIGYSFIQHYHMPLDGDMAEVIMPKPSSLYYEVLQDPFGLNALLKNETYSNPNRFFAHWSTSAYFKTIPLLLQKFIDPIESVYLSSALAKIFIQVMIIYLLAVYITGSGNVLKNQFLIAAILITPLFQTSGYNRYMGIIDQSVTFTFFYALPLCLLLLFFLPFFKAVYNNQKPKLNIIVKVLLALMLVFLSLNGPLVSGVVLIVCPLVLLNKWRINYKQMDEMPFFQRVFYAIKKIPHYLLFYFIGISVLSLYSLYIGKNNILNTGDFIPLIDRYLRLPAGIYFQFTQKLGFPLLFLMIAINAIIINKHYKTTEGQKILNLLKWVGIFTLIYILLLPLGGYRIYRSNILRYDTIMPITLGLMFIFGKSTLYLINNISKKYKKIYVSGIVVFLLIFTNSDRLDISKYECEKQALETIAQSPEKIILLNCDCTVMTWRKLYNYNHSERNAELLNYWNITNEKKLYYQIENSNK